MAKNRFGIQFEGFEELMENLDRLGGDLKEVATECLEVAPKIIAPKLQADMQKHRRTGDTAGSIVTKAKVEWEGTTAGIDVGFEFPEGLPSIFLMYGTPRMKKDTKLYNDVYGAAVKKKIGEAQAEILHDAINKRMGG